MRVLVSIALAAVLMLTASVAFATIVSTDQTWSFTGNSNPASPDAGYVNAFGAPTATFVLGTGGTYSAGNPGAGGTGTTYGKWWDLGASGRMTLNIPKAADLPVGLSSIQVTMDWYSGGVYVIPEVTAPGVSGAHTSVQLGSWTSAGSMWKTDTWTYTIDPTNKDLSPLSMLFTAGSQGSRINKVRIVTNGIEDPRPPTEVPEAGSLMLACSGLLGIVGLRRRYAK